MKNLLLISLLFLLNCPSMRAQTPVWQHVAVSGGAADTTIVYATAADAAGNVVVAGILGGQGSTFGATTLVPQGRGAEGFVAKLSAAGQWLWAVAVSSPGDSPDEGIKLVGIGVDAVGNVYIGGDYDDTLTLGPSTLLPIGNASVPPHSSENAFIASLDPAGNWRWGLAYDLSTTSRAALGGLAVDAAGYTTVTGEYNDRVTFGTVATLTTPNPTQQGYVARASPLGQWQWAVGAHSSNNNGRVDGLRVAVDGAGNAYVTGAFDGAVVLGTTTLTATTAYGALFVAKLSFAGQWQWAVQAEAVGSGSSHLAAYSIAAAPTGAVYIGGVFGGNLMLGGASRSGSGAWLAALSPQGQWTWSHATHGVSNALDMCTGLAADPTTGDVLAFGYVSDSTFFDAATPVGANGLHLFVARFGAAGTGQWALGVGNGQGFGSSLAAGPGGMAYVGGRLYGGAPVAFGPVTVTTGPGIHSFVARLGPPPGLPAESVGLSLAPNPARHLVRLTGAPAGPVVVLDAVGRVARTGTIGSGPAENEVSIEGLRTGLYTVRAGQQTRRLVVE